MSLVSANKLVFLWWNDTWNILAYIELQMWNQISFDPRSYGPIFAIAHGSLCYMRIFFDALVIVIVVVANGPYRFVSSQLVPSAHGGSYNSLNPLRMKLFFRREVQIWDDVWFQHTECNAKESAHGLTTASNIIMPYLYKKVCRPTTNTALEYSLKGSECLLSDPFILC